jgi:hypothetical protein
MRRATLREGWKRDMPGQRQGSFCYICVYCARERRREVEEEAVCEKKRVKSSRKNLRGGEKQNRFMFAQKGSFGPDQ